MPPTAKASWSTCPSHKAAFPCNDYNDVHDSDTGFRFQPSYSVFRFCDGNALVAFPYIRFLIPFSS